MGVVFHARVGMPGHKEGKVVSLLLVCSQHAGLSLVGLELLEGLFRLLLLLLLLLLLWLSSARNERCQRVLGLKF